MIQRDSGYGKGRRAGVAGGRGTRDDVEGSVAEGRTRKQLLRSWNTRLIVSGNDDVVSGNTRISRVVVLSL